MMNYMADGRRDVAEASCPMGYTLEHMRLKQHFYRLVGLGRKGLLQDFGPS